MAENQLIGSSVFDRSGHFLGKVTRVEPQSGGDFLLILPLAGNEQTGPEITLDSRYINDIDTQQKILHVNLDYQEILPGDNQTIQLLEERLVVNRKRHKVGEISVRKVIETEIVEIPVQREKLVIEKVGEAEPLVEVGLGETHLVGDGIGSPLSEGTPGTTKADSLAPSALKVSGEFLTIRDLVSFLDAIAHLPDCRCRRFRITLFLRKQLGLESSLHEFETPETAVQILSRLEAYLFEWCSGTRLELFLRDQTLRHTYQTWFAEYPQ